tara:strand:- start:488 stop:1369 length:882 start_codon:yes stop_codon:yes gene_type:complete
MSIDIQRIDTERDLLGEGPLWDPQNQVLYWVDIVSRRIRRLDPSAGDVTNWSLPDLIGCLALREGGGAVVALKSGFHFFDFESGLATLIIDPEAGEDRTRFNDGTVDRQGRFIAGSMEMSDTGDETGLGSLYRLNTDLGVETLRENVKIANGACFSPDGGTFYFADTPRQMIWAYDYDCATGALSHVRTFVDLHSLDAWPDGATVDAEGCLWTAFVTQSRIARYSPGGELMQMIDTPADHPSCVAFGGSNLDVLYVTSIWEFEGVKGHNENDGHLFAIHGLDAVGLPEPRFAG